MSSFFLFSDAQLMGNVTYLGVDNGHKVYLWDWNNVALAEFGLDGSSYGVIAQEVEKIRPDATIDISGFKAVDYDLINVRHG